MIASERAWQIWPVLALAARNRQTLTYDILGNLIGVPRQGLGHLLEPIQSFCLLNELPSLPSLVVKQTGLPGVGFVAAQDVPREHERVFDFDWARQPVPSPTELADAKERMPSNGVVEEAQ
jgi:hypothetical protein